MVFMGHESKTGARLTLLRPQPQLKVGRGKDDQPLPGPAGNQRIQATPRRRCRNAIHHPDSNTTFACDLDCFRSIILMTYRGIAYRGVVPTEMTDQQTSEVSGIQ
jgi:hypothetical protein